MGRRSSGRSRSRTKSKSSSSSGGLFGGGGGLFSKKKKAPTRSAPRRAAPAPAPRQNAPPPAAAPAPAPAAGGGMMGGLGGMIMQGMAFGGGSAVAHRAVDAIAGPRTVNHEHSGPEGQPVQQEQQQPMANQSQQPMAAQSGQQDGNCGEQNQDFNQCLQGNQGNISACKFYFDVLTECQQKL
mmetsp:Transcript_10062/g.11455  ORF Transcript_10062/g.11455 Transcript_10062/m.11455 type:complete len:183 (+) Transcript_10062:45-593(+)|eukprot:CAMPEP_0205822540 /NCGR_PEP_ID=MMETSP0206-20130828/12950_1 /ASSEMBLY_ACC=CAM_ASM_000279 /TAXON_ID=36767 /ORGANISM="Euplotes focardii, Strain TN1" /LENGTH=182 /DNA_ID=CAMNT_0053118903 /DNA_START=39 /DNA_END=587 /DNA_ORIENTATION=+